jgi:hypothetical protein
MSGVSFEGTLPLAGTMPTVSISARLPSMEVDISSLTIAACSIKETN